MRQTNFLAVLAGLGVFSLLPSARADDIIKIRVSYKVILNPVDGSRPPGVRDSDIDDAIATSNDLLSTFWRGFRFQRVGTITDIGGVGEFSRPSPSHYYAMDFGTNPAEKANLESDVQNNPARYAWNNSAINLLVTNTPGSSFDYSGDAVSRPLVVIAADSDSQGRTHLHEIGHFISLCHTQGCGCGKCSDCPLPGDDGIADTIKDSSCWNRDDIVSNDFPGNTYDTLTPSQKTKVDNVFLNVMSYHGSYDGGPTCVEHGHYTGDPNCDDHTRETEDQLDVWADFARLSRGALCDGITVFVDAGAGPFQIGTSVLPYSTVASGLSTANSGRDIVLIRSGSYLENLRIAAPITLRAPRNGHARIGANR
jgi:hypothetical protein